MTNERLPELPLEPEEWTGSDEWAVLADARQRRAELLQEIYREDY